MADGFTAVDRAARLGEARERACATPLADFQVADIAHFTSDTHWPSSERLRREHPVHWCAESEYGPYWSVTRFNDIIAVDGNHAVFSSSSELGGIAIVDSPEPSRTTSFIGLDPPDHDIERKVVAPMFSTDSMTTLAPLIRSRAAAILDELPIGETFDFVDRVSVELTSQMLATLFDFPFEHRRLLPRASDLILAVPGPDSTVASEAERQGELFATVTRFIELWNQRQGAAPRNDLISMLATIATGGQDPYAYVGKHPADRGRSDTTRHSISGALLAMNETPDAYRRLCEAPALLESAVPEIIRWQSPVAHMRRTALADHELGGKTIRKGDKVVMWYVSGNRDDTVIDNPDAFVIDRSRPRQHVAFGFGIHRCVGSRLAEMQLRIVWEEILRRFPFIGRGTSGARGLISSRAMKACPCASPDSGRTQGAFA